MALIKSLQATGSTGHHYFTLYIYEDSYSIANNTSTISWYFEVSPKDKYYDWQGWGKNVSYSVNVNGTTTTGYIPDYADLEPMGLNSKSNIVITHDSDGSKTINISFSISSNGFTRDYLPGTASASSTATLTNIPRKATITSAPTTFTDEDSPTIYYSNPAGNAVSVLQTCIAVGNEVLIPYKDLIKTDDSYTYNFTEAERKILRESVVGSNTKALNFYITTVISGTYHYDVVPTTLEIINATPTMNPSVIDTGGNSTALTGNPNTMIKGFNVMRVVMNAQAYKNASITDRKIINSSNTLYTDSGVFVNTNSNTFEFRLNDSRNNDIQQTITVPMVNYIPLTCNVDGKIELDSEDGTKAVITFTVSGNYFSGSFGAVNNELKLSYSLEYEGGGISLTPITIPASAINSDGTYSLEYEIPNKLDYKKSYTIKVYAEDKINSLSSSSKTLKAVPVFDWSENDFNFNVPVSINGTDIDYPVEQGAKNGWYYRKWNSGFAECWYSATVTGIDVGEFNLNGFYYCGSKGVNFPFTFTEVNYINASGGSTGNMNIVRPFGNTTTSMTYIVVGMSDVSNATVKINLEAKGLWK